MTSVNVVGTEVVSQSSVRLTTGFFARYFTIAALVRLVPISVVLLTGIALTVWTHRLLSEHRDLVVHTHEVIEMAKDVLIGLDDAETGQRGYLITADRHDLEPYRRARKRLGTMADTLKAQVSDNASQTEHVAQLFALMATKLDRLQAAITARDAHGFEAARSVVLSGSDQATMDAIRYQIGQITHGELTLLSARDVEVQADESRVRLVAILVGLASLLTRVGVELYLTRQQAHLARP